ncbi:MAG: hypothetical protein QGI63_07250, partial [Rhodospirillales bacterium]|nr:hypothetical protein [Rhodospirillales bacterium]
MHGHQAGAALLTIVNVRNTNSGEIVLLPERFIRRCHRQRGKQPSCDEPKKSRIFLEDRMSQFVENPTDFSAECMVQEGRCMIDRENIVFLDDGNELAAVDRLQWKCGYVVIIPDKSYEGKALLYHTSCQRMTDVVKQIFKNCLEAPVSVPQRTSEMTLGEMHRRCVTLSYDDCRVRVEGFGFQG